jgi:hypothetical protein
MINIDDKTYYSQYFVGRNLSNSSTYPTEDMIRRQLSNNIANKIVENNLEITKGIDFRDMDVYRLELVILTPKEFAKIVELKARDYNRMGVYL